MGPFQPDGLCQDRQVQGMQHLGQAWSDPVGTLRVELTEREAQTAVVADRQQRARLGAIVGGLAAAGLEQLGHLIGGEGAAEHLATKRKAVLQGAQLQGHWIGGGRPQPALETINSLDFSLKLYEVKYFSSLLNQQMQVSNIGTSSSAFYYINLLQAAQDNLLQGEGSISSCDFRI